MVRKELKKLRVDYDLTQQQLAEKLGISVATYSLIENGTRVGANRTWLKIQEVFQLSDEQMWSIQNPKN